MSSQRSIRDYFSNEACFTQPSTCITKRNVSSSFTQSSSKKFKCDEIIIISDSDDDEDNNSKQIGDVIFHNSGTSTREKSESVVGFQNEDNNNEFLDLNDFLNLEIKCSEESTIGDSEASPGNNGVDFKLNVFKEMIFEVLNDSQFGKLFNDEDWNVIQRFTCLSGPSQRLFVRLYVRKREWKRNITYKEISDDLSPLLEELVTNSFLLPISELRSLRSALNLLDVNEIKVLFKEVNAVCNGAKTKEACIDAILDHVRSNQTIESQLGGENTMTFVVLRRVKRKLNKSAFRLNDEQCRVFDRMALLFFPPDINDDEIGMTLSDRLYNLMNVERGVIRYPSFSLNRKTETFQTRKDLINYEESCAIERDILVAKEKRNFKLIADEYLKKTKQYYAKFVTKETLNKDRQLPDFIRRLTAGYILTRCLSHCVEILECLKQYEEAVKTYKVLLGQTVYCLDYRGKWYERLTINYETHLKQRQLAFETVGKSLQDNKVRCANRFSLYRRGLKLKETLKLSFPRLSEFDTLKVPQQTIESSSLRKPVNDRKNIFISVGDNDDVTILPVEQVALEYYKNAGYVNGVHCEGIIYHSIFGLLFWDVLYYSGIIVKDAFRSRCQPIPLDLNYDTFFNRRKDLILQRLDQLRKFSVEEINSELEKVWNDNYGSLSLVNWDACELKQLKEIIECSRGGAFIEICARMAREFRHCRSGFPDLLMWNPDQKTIIAVEVKGPGDQVSPKQALWIDYFNKKGLTAEVCYVKAKKV